MLINGSPRGKGNTYIALSEVAKALEANGVEAEIVSIGAKAVQGCIACGRCAELGRCAFNDALYNKVREKLEAADGIVIGSPVYYAGPNGSLCALLDRLFYSASPLLRYKPAAAVAVCRRGGASATFDPPEQVFHHKLHARGVFAVLEQRAWTGAGEASQDAEGLQTMRTLGDNMAWVLKSLKGGGQPVPEREAGIMTNFIR